VKPVEASRRSRKFRLWRFVLYGGKVRINPGVE
jgi:hypothetical protein